MPTKPVCRYCGSDDVYADATARWDIDTQDWAVMDVHESGLCGDCGEQNKFFDWEDAECKRNGHRDTGRGVCADCGTFI